VRLGERGACFLGAQEVEDVVRDKAVDGAASSRHSGAAVDEGDGGAVPPPLEPLRGQRDHPRAQVDADVRSVRRHVDGQQRGCEPARAAAQLDDGVRVVEVGVRHELVGGGVLVEALPVLGPGDAVVDPASLLRGQGGHPGMMARWRDRKS
jgi:hypothetical protein